MRIALDYDKTYTAMPEVWDVFIAAARAAGHAVEIVTMRYGSPDELIPDHVACKVDYVVYTRRKGKARHMQFMDRPVDIWIDDCPRFILLDAEA
jgi:hypothetical protein